VRQNMSIAVIGWQHGDHQGQMHIGYTFGLVARKA